MGGPLVKPKKGFNFNLSKFKYSNGFLLMQLEENLYMFDCYKNEIELIRKLNFSEFESRIENFCSSMIRIGTFELHPLQLNKYLIEIVWHCKQYQDKEFVGFKIEHIVYDF